MFKMSKINININLNLDINQDFHTSEQFATQAKIDLMSNKISKRFRTDEIKKKKRIKLSY